MAKQNGLGQSESASIMARGRKDVIRIGFLGGRMGFMLAPSFGGRML